MSGICLLATTLLLALLPAAEADAGGASCLRLGSLASVYLDPDVGIVISAPEGGDVLLSVRPEDPLRRSRWRQGLALFEATYAEGAPGGRRGFSDRADDDGDGAVDEDRPDGLDNDGDGRIDEDFAAIGDHMLVLAASGSRGTRQIEAFHWTYPHLENTLFVRWSRESAGDPMTALPEPGILGLETEASVWHIRRDEAGRATRVASVETPDGRLWIGLSLLESADDGIAPPVIADDPAAPRIEHSGRAEFVMAFGRSLFGLRRSLDTARAVRAGARPRPDADPIPWIVPPLAPIDERSLPAATWRDDDGGWRLDLPVVAGSRWLPDPDGLSLEGRALGAPRRLEWLADDGAAPVLIERFDSVESAVGAKLSWPDLPCRRAIEDDVGGRLGLVFPSETRPFGSDHLDLRTLCGRTLELGLAEAAAPEPVPVADTNIASALEQEPPSLSRDLLSIYPNPFRDAVHMEFRIPITVEEGFVWEKDNAPLLDPDAPIPYNTSTPSVSLKIYSLAGHEVASLFEASCDFGGYNATWNGLSDRGRHMAAGTYFCKLQIDRWSVTKRIVLLR